MDERNVVKVTVSVEYEQSGFSMEATLVRGAGLADDEWAQMLEAAIRQLALSAGERVWE